ncbi:MAG: TIGR02677 family protein [Micromonosporaceae bacterium]
MAAQPFAYLNASKTALYRSVMCAFTDAKRGFVVHLRPEDVAESVPGVPLEEVSEALKSLEGWGNLRADPDTGRVATVDDFYRPRYLYQLTREGEAVEVALLAYDEALGRRGELQAVALDDIRVRLGSLREQVAQPEFDGAVVHSLLRELATLLDGLAANAGAFMSSLQRTIDLQDVDEEAFLAYKDRLIDYLQRFVGDLVVRVPQIAATLRDIDGLDPDRMLRAVAEREAADAVPDPEHEGPSPVELRLAEWRSRWSGLHAWFLGDRAHPSQASLLRQRARAAIPALLTTVSTLQERRSGRTDRSADFRALARWFAQTDSDADAHRLWRAAFGLTSSRHLAIDPATTADWQQRRLPATTPWAQAPPVTVSPRLRATGQYQRRGKTARVTDRSAGRELLAARLAAERAEAERVRRRMATGRPIRLSELGPLGGDEFRLLLSVLGDALAAGPPGADGTIRTTTSDGALELVLSPPADGRTAEILTEDGVLRGPDMMLTVTEAAGDVPAGDIAAGDVPAEDVAVGDVAAGDSA